MTTSRRISPRYLDEQVAASWQRAAGCSPQAKTPPIPVSTSDRSRIALSPLRHGRPSGIAALGTRHRTAAPPFKRSCSREQDREINGLIEALATRTPSAVLQTIGCRIGDRSHSGFLGAAGPPPPTLSLMVTGKPWTRESPKSTKLLRPLREEQFADLPAQGACPRFLSILFISCYAFVGWSDERVEPLGLADPVDASPLS
jgi:hypothetical protein